MESSKISTSLSVTEYMRLKAEERRRKLGTKPRNKITPAQIEEIRVHHNGGMSISEIMRRYPVGYNKLKKLLGEDKKEKKEVVESAVEIAVETKKEEDPAPQL